MWNCFHPKWCHIDILKNDYFSFVEMISTKITSPHPLFFNTQGVFFLLYIKLFVALNRILSMYINKSTHRENTGLENYQQTQILLLHFTMKNVHEQKIWNPCFYQLIVRMSSIHLLFCLFVCFSIRSWFLFFFNFFLFSSLVPSMFESETYKLLLYFKAHTTTKKKLPLRHTNTCTIPYSAIASLG